MRLLVVGKLSGHITRASEFARNRGARVSHCDSVEKALDVLRSGKGIELVMFDVALDIEVFIEGLKNEHIAIPVVACGLDNDSKRAVDAIKAGAKEYVPLPPDEELIAAVLASISENSCALISNSAAMQRIVRVADQIAPSDANVLITGESGTGKEVIANYIHSKSKRAARDMISLNCAAIPDNLLESELFGHEKGAFTGAVARRIGKFEEADNSTILLDEISEMDSRLQAKLLRAIQEKEIDRVGGSKPIKVNIRILATSNRDLQEEVKQGRFRQDLFFRLNVIQLSLPPLRDRSEDIPIFADHFIQKYADLNGVPVKPLSKKALEKLQHYAWPGNVRELENMMHRSILMAVDNSIQAHDILLQGEISNDNDFNYDETSCDNDNGSLVNRTVASVEKELILNTLDHCSGNRTKAATVLGISIRTLRNKLNEYKQNMAM